ncbi:DedA family protein [Amycolatopsis jiangsuensis]|uniref:Membrane protein DedA with SNARE-associated domain n=1 Tax=Amycolatopsis jiangsuensis TaxID=1181879 RepID=A0A840J4M8_9PSEU|nr:DedA family protein [Amycolatopsis jiangsuensis]MBB4688294.1 membrane protein DedA with SNARE-associated domain [Amycolatopsis jiangsuensis]
MDSLLRPLLDAPAPLIYAVCALVIVAETALLPGIVLPTLSTLLLMGMLVQRGTLTWWLALPVAVVAAVAGDQLAYLEGRLWGPRLRTSRFARRIGTERWDKAEATVVRYGVPAVVLGRCLAGIRTLVPRVAGSSGLPYRRFLPGSLGAALLWAGVELSVGQLTGWVTP